MAAHAPTFLNTGETDTMKKMYKQFRRNREHVLFNRKLAICLIPLVIVLALTAWIASCFMEPAPPHKIVMTAGAKGGAYEAFAAQYAKALKKEGFEVEVVPSKGSVENFERLHEKDSVFDVAFIQSGIGDAKEAPELRTLASLYYEPIWVFYRGRPVDKLAQLEGKKVAINVPGSGVYKVATDLLAESGLDRKNTQYRELNNQEAFDGLKKGTVDAAFFIAGPEAPIIQKLLKSDLKLMSFSQAPATLKKFPSLSIVTFPRGAISLAQDLPPHDITMLSATAMLVAKDTLHPAIMQLLLNKAHDIHSPPGFFWDADTFPNQKVADFPVPDEAKRYLKDNKSFLQRYMPFWLANFIERMLVIVVPMVAMLVPVAQIMPGVYQFILKADLVRWYGEIKMLEDEIWHVKTPSAEQIASWYREIEEISAKVHELNLPQAHVAEVYRLKQSITVVRERILIAESKMAGGSDEAAAKAVQRPTPIQNRSAPMPPARPAFA
jgi:TRAP transporter TAXI family solute receptor